MAALVSCSACHECTLHLHTLSCGHSVCVSCCVSSPSVCPFCRSSLFPVPPSRNYTVEQAFESVSLLSSAFTTSPLHPDTHNHLHTGNTHTELTLFPTTPIEDVPLGVHELYPGYAVIKDASGTYFEGFVTDKKKHGFGKTVDLKGEKYAGSFQNDLREGLGLIQWSDNSEYFGNFSSGVRHGYGKMVFSDGSGYEGYWEKDQKQGYGRMKWTGSGEYLGNWLEDQITGLGLMRYGQKSWYFGYFLNGFRSGFGLFHQVSGKVYIGDFADNLKDGYGIERTETGSETRGLYVKGKKSKGEVQAG